MDALRAARAPSLRRIASLTRHFDGLIATSVESSADDEHDPEGVTIAFERSPHDLLVHLAGQQLAEIDAAEDRLALGRCGLCETPGRPIALSRPEVRPSART